MMRWLLLCCCMVLFIALPVSAQLPDWLDTLDPERCPNGSEFICVTLAVPRDHFDSGDDSVIEVVFAVLPAASGESQGLFVTVTGGPGTAGIGLADIYASYFDQTVLDSFDVIFFDQRGIGLSGGLDCPYATAAYALSDARPTTLEGEAAIIDAAQTYAQDCQEEIGSPDLLGYLGTNQAVRDLEIFRTLADDQPMWLYGESYGTQYAQTYAAAFPDALAGLILDGVVDLTLSGVDYYTEQANGFDRALALTLQACNEDPACASDMGTDAVAFYDDFAAELAASPVSVGFPLADGSVEERSFTINTLETAAINAMYGRDGRAGFLRQLAAAARGDLVPLLREFYASAGVDPFTFEPVIDPTYFTSMYYAVECSDYAYFGGTPEERAAAFIESGDAIDESGIHLGIIYYGDLPCVFWDSAQPPVERPAALTGGDYVTFILNSSTDPATPPSNGYAVFDRLNDAYMITMEGGPHVLFGREATCPDVAITQWMVDGILPSAREFICPGEVIEGYTPLNPTEASDYPSALSAILAVETEINLLPEYIIWDLESDLYVGCPFGGWVLFTPTKFGEAFEFNACAFINGFALDGMADYVWGESIIFDVIVNGSDSFHIIYTHDLMTEMYAIDGAFGRDKLVTPRPVFE